MERVMKKRYISEFQSVLVYREYEIRTFHRSKKKELIDMGRSKGMPFVSSFIQGSF